MTVTKGDKMGAVYIKVRLSNAWEETKARRGEMRREDVRSYETVALVDTGVMRSVIPPHVMERLGLMEISRQPVRYADGRIENVPLTEPVSIEIEGRNTMEQVVALGDKVLIGQTVLEVLDMQVDCTRQRLVPNPAHPDQPIIDIVEVETASY